MSAISAFYYTPVHAIFIGVLFATGFSLIALRGRDRVEDLFFNLAGFLAPVVALVKPVCTGSGSVPQPDRPSPRRCRPVRASLAPLLPLLAALGERRLD